MELFHVIRFTQPFNQREKEDYRAHIRFAKQAKIINPTDSQSDWIVHRSPLECLVINLICLRCSCLNKGLGSFPRLGGSGFSKEISDLLCTRPYATTKELVPRAGLHTAESGKFVQIN